MAEYKHITLFITIDVSKKEKGCVRKSAFVLDIHLVCKIQLDPGNNMQKGLNKDDPVVSFSNRCCIQKIGLILSSVSVRDSVSWTRQSSWLL